MRLRSQSLPLEQAGERDWALRRWPVVEEGGGGIGGAHLVEALIYW